MSCFRCKKRKPVPYHYLCAECEGYDKSDGAPFKPTEVDRLKRELSEARKALHLATEQRTEAISIARRAIEGVEMVYGHAQFCDECQSFEIAQECRNELHGFERLKALESAL